jgi:hypothetical protein
MNKKRKDRRWHTKKHRNGGTWYVTVYETERVYGGPEEGGWYYTAGEAIRHIRVRGFNAANRLAEEITDSSSRKIINGEFGYELQSPYSDCDDDGSTQFETKIEARVSRERGDYFPKERPYYC